LASQRVPITQENMYAMVASTETQVATYQIDPSHSQVEFSVKHLVITTTKGRFGSFSGEIVFDPVNIENSSVSVTIDADSIDTRDAKRDEHLRSNDFFGIGDNPQITFVSTRVEPKGKDTFTVYGDLTMAGVTREVALDARYNGTINNPWGQTVSSFSATTEIDRKDFGITWNAALEGGGVLVSDEVKISLEIEAIKQ
jgi:polyisoprenoid-binding protein YceI